MAAISPQNPPQPLLTVEDDMEISSDAGRPQDDSVEMDRDNNTEDEYMIEDGTQIPTEGRSILLHSNDDVMLDSDDEDGIFQDEVLRDASVEFDEDIQINDLQEPQETNLPTIPEPADDLNVSHLENHPDQPVIPNEAEFKDTRDFAFTDQTVESQDADTNKRTLSQHNGQVESIGEDKFNNLQGPSSESTLNEDTGAEVKSYNDSALPSDYFTNEEIPEGQRGTGANREQHELEESASATSEPIKNPDVSTSSGELIDDNEEQSHDGGEATKAILHPTIIMYEGSEIHLFPPTDHTNTQTFFLKDESIAYQTIGDLLLACREVLGDSIDIHEELELGIAVLGLTIGEGSIHCVGFTFNDILNTYVQLCHNDGISDAGPLYVTLNTQPKFSTRLDSLRISATEGKGLSEIEFLHLDDELYDSIDPTITETGQGDDFSNEQAVDDQQALVEVGFNSIMPAIKNLEQDETEDLRRDNAIFAVDNAGQESAGDTGRQLKGVEVSDEFPEPEIATEENVTNIDQNETKETDDVNHPEDDLLDFGDEDPNNEVGQLSSGSSTIQGEVTHSTAETDDWHMSAANEELETQQDEVDFEPIDDEDTPNNTLDTSTESIIPKDATGDRKFDGSHFSNAELAVGDDKQPILIGREDGNEDDIHFDDEFDAKAEIGDSVEDSVDGNGNHGNDRIIVAAENNANSKDTEENEWEEETELLEFEKREEGLETETVQNLQQKRQREGNNSINSQKVIDEPEVTAEDTINYSDDEDSTITQAPKDTTKHLSSVKSSSPALSRKRSWSEGEENFEVDETPQSSKKSKPS